MLIVVVLTHSNQFDAGQNTVPARNVNKGRQQAPKPCKRQTLNKGFFEKLWKVNQKTKIVHYFDNYNRIFFFKAKMSNIWLKIRLPFEHHAEGATCQRVTGCCGSYMPDY